MFGFFHFFISVIHGSTPHGLGEVLNSKFKTQDLIFNEVSNLNLNT
jgi:hypothetical protein